MTRFSLSYLDFWITVVVMDSQGW